MQLMKINSKISQVLPSNWHQKTCKYAGHINIGGENHWSEWFDSKDEAKLELRCMEKRLSFELINTVEGEGYYPERADRMEAKYQASGRTNSLYTGLNIEDGSLSNNTSS